jgi:HlyD family secretion protein
MNVTNPQTSSAMKSALDQAQANYDEASKNLLRQKALLAKGYVSQSTVDTAQQQNDAAGAQLADAKIKMSTVDEQNTQTLNSARAKLNQSFAAITQAKASLKQADAALNSANAQLKTAETNAQEDPTIKADDYAAAKSTLSQTQAALDLAKANRAQEQMRLSDQEQSYQALVNAQAVKQNAITNNNWCTVTAPCDGIVLQKFVEVGSTVVNGRQSAMATGNGVSIVTIGDIKNMTALVDVDETDLAQVTLNQYVHISVDAFPTIKFVGKVMKIAPQTTITQNVTTVPVTVTVTGVDSNQQLHQRVAPQNLALLQAHQSGAAIAAAPTSATDPPNPLGQLKPGMTATCDFIIQQKNHVLVAPNEAIKVSDHGSIVTVLVNNKPIERQVEIGLEGDDTSEVLSGLIAGDKVVTATITPSAGGQTTSTNGQNKSGSSSSRPPRGPF